VLDFVSSDRSASQREMETFTTLIVNKMKDAKMFAGQGGPIILAQVHIRAALLLFSLSLALWTIL